MLITVIECCNSIVDSRFPKKSTLVTSFFTSLFRNIWHFFIQNWMLLFPLAFYHSVLTMTLGHVKTYQLKQHMWMPWLAKRNIWNFQKTFLLSYFTNLCFLCILQYSMGWNEAIDFNQKVLQCDLKWTVYCLWILTKLQLKATKMYWL